MFDIGKLLERLRARPYDEVRYRWDNKEQTHTVTCCLGDQQASYMLAEEFVLRVRAGVAEGAMTRFDEELWEKIGTAEEEKPCAPQAGR